MNITDTFNRADNTSSLGTTSDGKATWVPTTGTTWSILSNQARSVAAAGPVYVETGGADGTIQVDCTTSTAHEALVARLSDDSNYWLMTGSTLYKVVAGSFTSTATWTWSGGPETRKVVCSGGTIKCYVGTTLVATVTDTFNQTATKHGLSATTGTDGRWDNFSSTTGVTFVQQALLNPSSSSNTSYTVSLAAAATAGNTAVLAIAYSGTVSSVSGLGATWVRKATNADPVDGSDGLVDIWVGTGITSGALTDVTVTFSVATRPVLNLSEWSGVNSVAQASGALHASASSASTPSEALATAGDVAFGVVAINTFGGITISSYTDSPSAWTTLSGGSSAWMNYTLVPAYISGVTGSVTRQGNFSGSTTSITQALVLSPAFGLAGSSGHTRTAAATISLSDSLSGSSSHTRSATASISIADHLTGASTHTHGAAASIYAPIEFTAPVDIGWESNGRTRDASATIDVDGPDPATPSTHHQIQMQWLDITGLPDLDANSQPVASTWGYTRQTDTWGHYRIRIGGKVVTFFRGCQTIVAQESDTEPFGDDTLQLIFPAIGPFELLGAGDLDWLPGADNDDNIPVVIHRVHPDGTKSIRFEGDIDGIVDTYDGRTAGLVLQVTGVIKTLDQRVTKPRMTSDPVDCGKFLHDLVKYEIKYGWNGHGLPVVDTDIQTAERGGYGDPLATVTIQNLLGGMHTTDTQWTITNRRPRGMRLIVKDRDSIDFTLWCGQPGVTHNLTRDLSTCVRAIFGEGMDHGSQFWRNTKYPNAEDDPVAYPLADGVFFNPGDGHTGFQDFSDELGTRGYDLDSQNTYLASDTDTIEDFQTDAGITVDGVVGPQTWNAAFTTGVDAHFLDAYIKPLAVVTEAEPFLYNTRGGIIGKNPGYTGRTRRERKEDFGTLSKRYARKSAKFELAVTNVSDYAGDVTLTNIDPPQMCALDIRSGMNYLFKNHRGHDRVLHIAKANRTPGMQVGQDRVVTLSSSGRGDDYVTLADRLQRKHDVVDQSGRTKAPRRGARISPDFAPWDEEAGAGRLKPRAQTAGLWNIYEVPSGERGTITHVRLVANTPTLIAAAVFNWKITANHLASLSGLDDPSAGGADGSDPWQANATELTVRPTYADQPWLAWATGGPGAMQGYWPNDPAADGTVSGVLDDSQEWPFHSRNGTWLWLAVWTSENCRISGDPAYRYRALFPGAP